MPNTIRFILNNDKNALQTALKLDPSTARIEVQCLLQAALRVKRVYLHTYPERILSCDEAVRYSAMLARRLTGEPIAYILGEREFYGLNFKVTSDTLIPRPDTELLVERVLQRIQSDNTYRVLDMGTGSGAIALAIAYHRPNTQVVAVDYSESALNIAKENASLLNIRNIRLLHSDWFSQLSGERFDIIVSNPPYIEADDIHLQSGDLVFEPLSALASGDDGLDDIRRIITGAKAHLAANGELMLEHGYNQAGSVRQLLKCAGFNNVASICDLSGIERVTVGGI
jgi:release factor glutamine methyltransferase